MKTFNALSTLLVLFASTPSFAELPIFSVDQLQTGKISPKMVQVVHHSPVHYIVPMGGPQADEHQYDIAEGIPQRNGDRIVDIPLDMTVRDRDGRQVLARTSYSYVYNAPQPCLAVTVRWKTETPDVAGTAGPETNGFLSPGYNEKRGDYFVFPQVFKASESDGPGQLVYREWNISPTTGIAVRMNQKRLPIPGEPSAYDGLVQNLMRTVYPLESTVAKAPGFFENVDLCANQGVAAAKELLRKLQTL